MGGPKRMIIHMPLSPESTEDEKSSVGSAISTVSQIAAFSERIIGKERRSNTPKEKVGGRK